MEMPGIWLAITDYSDYRNISVSTIRRYIKAGQLKYRKEKGRYLVFVSEENYQKKQSEKGQEALNLKLEIERLKNRIKQLEEENEDLKMLVKLYERKVH